jgi:hypothetical protein
MAIMGAVAWLAGPVHPARGDGLARSRADEGWFVNYADLST